MTARRGQGLGAVADEILVERATQGDTAAFEALIRRHGPLMRAYVSRIVGSLHEADDVVQEAFYTAWRRLPELRDPKAVKAWLMQIASRQAFKHLRRRPPEDPLPVLEAGYPSEMQPENVAIRNARLHALATALDALAPDLRQAWLLREIGELSYDDIATQLDIPRTTVRGNYPSTRVDLRADGGMAVTDTTSRTLDCGKTIEELSDYLAADRIPSDPSIETCPECLNALQALSGVAQLSRDLLAEDAANLPAPPANWMEQIMATIHDEVRAGRTVPLHHPDPRVTLTVTEGALRALIRSVGDDVPGIIIGKCQFDGDVETPGAPIDVTITASIAWKYPIPEAARELRDAVRDALSTHSHLNIMLINVTVEDLHGHNTAE